MFTSSRRRSWITAAAIAACVFNSMSVVSAAELDGLDHYAVNVHDLKASADWYAKVLGFQVLHTWDNAWMIGRDNMKVGLFLQPKAVPLKDIDSQLIIQHVAFLVDGDKFVDALSEIRNKGIAIVKGPEDTGIAYSFFFKDLDGNLLEVTTYHATTNDPTVPGSVGQKSTSH